MLFAAGLSTTQATPMLDRESDPVMRLLGLFWVDWGKSASCRLCGGCRHVFDFWTFASQAASRKLSGYVILNPGRRKSGPSGLAGNTVGLLGEEPVCAVSGHPVLVRFLMYEVYCASFYGTAILLPMCLVTLLPATFSALVSHMVQELRFIARVIFTGA